MAVADMLPILAAPTQVMQNQEEDLPQELSAGHVRRPPLRPASHDKRGVWALPYAAALQATPEDIAEARRPQLFPLFFASSCGVSPPHHLLAVGPCADEAVHA
jgi:hypothetical protein